MRKKRISKQKTKDKQNPFGKSELDANEPQKPDLRVWELPGDMAHELEGDRDRNGNENGIWELEGDSDRDRDRDRNNESGVGVGVGGR